MHIPVIYINTTFKYLPYYMYWYPTACYSMGPVYLLYGDIKGLFVLGASQGLPYPHSFKSLVVIFEGDVQLSTSIVSKKDCIWGEFPSVFPFYIVPIKVYHIPRSISQASTYPMLTQEQHTTSGHSLVTSPTPLK